jgi:hypothetical protein
MSSGDSPIIAPAGTTNVIPIYNASGGIASFALQDQNGFDRCDLNLLNCSTIGSFTNGGFFEGSSLTNPNSLIIVLDKNVHRYDSGSGQLSVPLYTFPSVPFSVASAFDPLTNDYYFLDGKKINRIQGGSPATTLFTGTSQFGLSQLTLGDSDIVFDEGGNLKAIPKGGGAVKTLVASTPFNIFVQTISEGNLFYTRYDTAANTGIVPVNGASPAVETANSEFKGNIFSNELSAIGAIDSLLLVKNCMVTNNSICSEGNLFSLNTAPGSSGTLLGDVPVGFGLNTMNSVIGMANLATISRSTGYPNKTDIVNIDLKVNAPSSDGSIRRVTNTPGIESPIDFFIFALTSVFSRR